MAQEPGQKAGATQEFSAQNATQLARFREPGAGPGIEDGDRRHRQVAGRDRPSPGRADRDEREVKRRVDELWRELGL